MSCSRQRDGRREKERREAVLANKRGRQKKIALLLCLVPYSNSSVSAAPSGKREKNRIPPHATTTGTKFRYRYDNMRSAKSFQTKTKGPKNPRAAPLSAAPSWKSHAALARGWQSAQEHELHRPASSSVLTHATEGTFSTAPSSSSCRSPAPALAPWRHYRHSFILFDWVRAVDGLQHKGLTQSDPILHLHPRGFYGIASGDFHIPSRRATNSDQHGVKSPFVLGHPVPRRPFRVLQALCCPSAGAIHPLLPGSSLKDLAISLRDDLQPLPSYFSDPTQGTRKRQISTMAAFRPVNTTLSPDAYARSSGEETTPTTPRPNTAPTSRMEDPTTPTRATFSTMVEQKPLPVASFNPAITATDANEASHTSIHGNDSQQSKKSRSSGDVEMAVDSDGPEDESDPESVDGDGSRSSKKKKSQRFYCTDYPPCTLSFTRSEHLARHIRKHTGERPFQCHCSRRFSRLDNLRQHAQTVHVNEEIPNDSLAATGTRFQRQVRERARPAGNRSRASTSGSQTGPVRGHHRNSLSASSISSVGSAYSQRDSIRSRPAPLVMASDHRGRLSQEMYRPESPSHFGAYRPPSPGGFSTPTSATFSTGQNSPRWGSAIQSPISSHTRTGSLYSGSRTPGRRLSVPSTGNPFQSPHSSSFGPPLLGQLNSSNSGAYSPSNSLLASPTSSTTGSIWSRRESVSSVADEAWRRRTWHPETYTNFTSRLQNVTNNNYYQSVPQPQPQAPGVPGNAPPPQTTRLPGIESFDPLPRPGSPIRRGPSPMVIDSSPSRPPIMPEPYAEERRSQPQFESRLNRNLNRLDLGQGPPVTDTTNSWTSDVNRPGPGQAEPARAPPTVRFEQSTYPVQREQPRSFHQHTLSAPPITPKEAKRHGWYHGPMTTSIDYRAQRTSPEDSSSSEGGVPGTPSSAVATEYNPSIVHSGGWIESSRPVSQGNQAPPYSYPAPSTTNSYSYNTTPHPSSVPTHEARKTDNDMLRLEALVAVATSEGNAAAAAY
ncbi:hypothetical protein B7463_g9562, partial [Scytalidium lignicola]